VTLRNHTVRLLPAAEDDLIEIVTYVAGDNPFSALALADTIEKTWDLLSNNPLLGRVPREDELAQAGYRYLVTAKHYLIFYKVEGRTVYVHRIIHGARDYLRLF
jgi:toxin ParE1/3/4